MLKKEFINPNGIKFKFIVKPLLLEKHKNALKSVIYKNYKHLKLDSYFKEVDVTFNNNYKCDKVRNDNLKSKQMLIDITFTGALVEIEKDFYEDFKSVISKNVIKTVESCIDKKYECKFGLAVPVIRLN